MLRALADLDRCALRAFRTRFHDPRSEAAMKALGAAGEWGVLWAAVGLAAAAADEPRRERWLRAAAVGPAAIWANYVFKLAVRRKRPHMRGLPPLSGSRSQLSFPSAHAASSLAAATAMGRIAPRARPALYVLAVAVCTTRPYLGMHYPSDVLAGAALGVVLGRLVPGLESPEPPAVP